MSKFIKPSYEQLERNFQSYCKHDGGRRITAESDHTCSICGWDTTKCQHRKADSWDKYCRECGENLKKEQAQ